jgi:hypothetical protein
MCCAQIHKIPTSTQDEPRLVENSTTKIEPKIGLAYTDPLRLHIEHIFLLKVLILDQQITSMM